MNLFASGIRPAIDQWLLDKSREVRDYGDYWSASSAGYCQRKVIFERLGVPHVETEADARKQRVFTAGHLFHDWIQGITKQAGLSIASEVELQDEDLMIRGHFDDLVLIKGAVPQLVRGRSYPSEQSEVAGSIPASPTNLILYDYKTVNSQSFKYKKDKMSHYHRLQLGTYMYMLRQKGIKQANGGYMGLDIREARILNISKDDLRMSETQLLWDAQLESDVLSYWKGLNDHWGKKTLPKCTCADHEGGFMAKEKWNPYYYEGEPCSIKWYEKFKEDSRVGN